MLGTLPTAAKARAFLAAHDPNKRRVLIDQVLERDERADYWALKWGDLLRIKAEFPINLWPNAAQAIAAGLGPLRENKPYDRFVARTAHGQRQQFPQAGGQFLSHRAEPSARRLSPRRWPWC